jgi:16S rRNA processing protein RimM
LIGVSTPEGLLEVGRIGRPHGIRGDVFLDLVTDHTERAQVGSKLRARDRWLTISQSSPSNKRWRVHFEGVDDRNAAEAITGVVVYAEPIDDPDALWIHELIGASVLEVNGIDRGRCVSVVSNPAADLLELDSKALVPVTFVTSVEHTANGVLITIDPPEGLFDLND